MYVLRGAGPALECLVLRRSGAGRCPGAWEVVHGHIEPGERPAEAALRELREETGLTPARFYNVSRVEAFYQHAIDTVALVPVFAAFAADGAQAVPGEEHDAVEWLPPAEAIARVAWPREARALEDIVRVFRDGHPGPIADVLHIAT